MASNIKGLNKGHIRIQRNGRRLYKQQIVWMEENNREIPEGFVIHHINFDPLDNRPANLQLMTNGEHVSLHNKVQLALDPKRKYWGKNIHLAQRG